jgi:hypothetical protein
MNNLNKLIIFCLLMTLILTLSGCSSTKNNISEDTGILDSSEYNTKGLKVNADYRQDISEWNDFSSIMPEGEAFYVPAAAVGKPNTTLLQVSQLLDGDLKTAKREIDSVYELFMLISFFEEDNGSNEIVYGSDRVRWEIPISAQISFEHKELYCYSATILTQYLLEDDYEEVGHVWRHNAPDNDRWGGHVTSYVKDGDTYFFFDPVTFIGSSYPTEGGNLNGDLCDIVVETKNPEKYLTFWTAASNDDVGIWTMHKEVVLVGSGNSSRGVFFYAKGINADEMKVWFDKADQSSMSFEKASYNPDLPSADGYDFSEFEIFEKYIDKNYDGGGNPTVKTMEYSDD